MSYERQPDGTMLGCGPDADYPGRAAAEAHWARIRAHPDFGKGPAPVPYEARLAEAQGRFRAAKEHLESLQRERAATPPPPAAA